MKNPLFTFEEMEKYKAIKARMKAGEFVPRDEFLFVKGKDMRASALRRIRQFRSFRDNVRGGFNSASR